ncbi:MAG: hypothetical protein ACRDF9_04135 [Candidatus Limnocylindria bacterium]
MDRHELAWAAGFFDGEGWAAKQKPRGVQARINQADPNGVPSALLRFQAALNGLGRIGGPTCEPERKEMYRWIVSSRGDVELLLELLRPWLGPIKLLQLARATGRAVSPAAATRGDDEWRAWAAGLFDGEGCSALLSHRTHAGYMSGELSVTQSSLVGSPEVLRRFAVVVGGGYISGPYPQRNATMDVYRWKVAALSDVERVIAELWPWLGEVKRAQAQRMLDVLCAQAALPRGNPAWGNRKTHCVNGHEYATARIRPYVGRGVGEQRRDSKQCLVCLRDYARKQREKKKSAADDDRRSLSERAGVYLLK